MLKKAMVPVFKELSVSWSYTHWYSALWQCCNRDEMLVKCWGNPEKREQLFLWKQRTFVWILKEDGKVWKGALSRGKGLHKALETCACIGEEFFMERRQVMRLMGYCGSGLFAAVLASSCLWKKITRAARRRLLGILNQDLGQSPESRKG